MIVVFIEVWPKGDQSKAKTLGMAEMTNDGTGSNTHGNYRLKLVGKTSRYRRQSVTTDFPRKSRNIWELLRRALNDVDRL